MGLTAVALVATITRFSDLAGTTRGERPLCGAQPAALVTGTGALALVLHGTASAAESVGRPALGEPD